MPGLLLVVCSMTLARRLQTHDHQSGTWRSPCAAERRRERAVSSAFDRQIIWCGAMNSFEHQKTLDRACTWLAQYVVKYISHPSTEVKSTKFGVDFRPMSPWSCPRFEMKQFIWIVKHAQGAPMIGLYSPPQFNVVRYTQLWELDFWISP